MGYPPFGLGFGARFLLDAHQNWAAEGLPVYLRIRNADDSQQEFADIGFDVTVTSSNLISGAGTTDLIILPQPTVQEVNLNDIGIMGGKLMFGAKRFFISHTWVLNQMQEMGYTNPLDVFLDPSRVVGIYYDNQLHTIEQLTHDDLGGSVLYWKVVCNAAQLNYTQGTGGGI